MRFSVQARFSLLLLVILAGVTGTLFVLQQSQQHQVGLFLRERVSDADSTFSRVMELKEAGYRVHVSDYSSWDEFVTYARKPDPHWAELYIHQNISRFGVDVAWVLDPRGRVIYTTRIDQGPRLPAVPVTGGVLPAKLEAAPFTHFFVRTSEGVLEIWTAPIQPAADLDRSTPPAGYYVIGRFWRPRVLADLSRATNGYVSLHDSGAPVEISSPSPNSTTLEVRQRLAGLDGTPCATLLFRVRYPVAKRVEDIARQTLWFTALASLVILLTAHGFVSFWVLGPLRTIKSTLQADDPALLGAMTRRSDELGQVARLVTEFFQQRDALVREARERSSAELQIVQQKDLVRRVIDADPNLIYVVDSGGQFALANVRAAATFGVDLDSLVGREALDVLAPLNFSESFLQTSARAGDTGEPQEVDETLTLPDRSIRQYHSIRSPLRRGEGVIEILTISTDVTEQIRYQRELLEARDAAEAGARAKAQFLANVSHELRTPMHGILSYSRFGLREWGTAERKDILDYFQNINESAESLLDLLNDLLDLSRVESGRALQLQFTSVDLEDILDHAVVEFESLLEERGIRLAVDVSGPLPPVRADRARILQVLRNLLSNAAKFTPTGKVIEITSEWDHGSVRLAIRDEGIGIPPDELESVFGMFIQSSHAGSWSGGTGLGLALCREIVNAHGGRIWAENRPTGGTSFMFQLPRADAAENPDPGEAAVQDSPTEDRAAA